jgi:hypothetical protein
MNGKRRSPWVYVGIGCTALFALAIVASVGAIWYLHHAAQRFAAELKDPAAREAQVKRVLGCETLPPGYRPFMAMSVPWVLDMAILSDRTIGAGGGHDLGKRGFIYMSVISASADDRTELREYVAGRQRHPRVLMQQQLTLDASEVLGRGQLMLGPTSVS